MDENSRPTLDLRPSTTRATRQRAITQPIEVLKVTPTGVGERVRYAEQVDAHVRHLLAAVGLGRELAGLLEMGEWPAADAAASFREVLDEIAHAAGQLRALAR